MPTIVALDLETTGLDPHRDAIIEIGAVRFNERRVEDEWSTLVNPGRHIPEFISNLTGISDGMVHQAPALQEILPKLQVFVEEAPVLGQNIRFDLSFLERFGLFPNNKIIDTYELAAVLMPSAGRYNLGALGQQLGIPLPASHRALDDARVTQVVFQKLHERAGQLPLDLLAEIVRLSESLEWDAGWIFQQVLRARAKEGLSPKAARGSGRGPLFESPDGKYPALKPVSQPQSLDLEEAAAILEHGGAFAKYFENYEYRPEQVEMLRAVTQALSEGQHLMVEAGTGVGKSLAYLIPAALWATHNNTRVVISTNTINLQEQLIHKDIPDLSAALGLDLRAAVLKGRSNYLCPRRLTYLRQHGPQTVDELRVLAKILVWLLDEHSGDRNQINLTGPAEREVWLRLSAEDDACTNETCLKRTGGTCPFYRAKLASQSAHLLVVNHALLLSDVAAGSRVLPEYDYLIIDEGHHLESATTNALSFRLTQNDLERMLREVGGSTSGVLGRVLSDTRDVGRPAEFGVLSQKVKRASDLAFRLENYGRSFFQTLGEFAAYQRDRQPPTNYAWQERILPSTRTLPGWDEVEIAWDQQTGETLRLLLEALSEIHKGLAELYAGGLDQLEGVIGDLGSLARRLTEAENNLAAMIADPSPLQVYWIEVQPNGKRVSLNAAPLQVGPLIEKHLWHEKASVVLTSATLTTHGAFDYMRNTLGADEADELALGSPFDYESSTLLYLADDIPEPNVHGYQQALERGLVGLCKASGGRALALFTSYAQLKRTSQHISGPLADAGIVVYEQGEGASPHMLLESFKASEHAVLLGTRSFWEGVDVPGQALSVLVIAKLPFDVPSDPLIAARSETYEDPFGQYYLPEAILKFRQGFGRLIRTQSDRGVVAIFDRRLLTKQYGQYFLGSLPQCTVKKGPLGQLPKLASQWLGM
jgi:ATP-dependent DNA helicase DinG